MINVTEAEASICGEMFSIEMDKVGLFNCAAEGLQDINVIAFLNSTTANVVANSH